MASFVGTVLNVVRWFQARLSRILQKEMLSAWGVPALVATLLVALWGLILYSSASQRAHLILDGQNEQAQLNTAVARHADGLLRSIESDLRILDRWLQANPKIDPRFDKGVEKLVGDMRSVSKGVLDPRLVTSSGDLFYVPSKDAKPLASVADRDYVTAHLNGHERKLFVGRPVISRVTGRQGIPVSWKLETPVSDISIVFANIELEKLVELHEGARSKPNGSVLLMRSDGVVLSRVPFDKSIVGRDFSDTPGFKEHYGVRPSGSYISDGKLTEGIPRLVNYQRLEDYPIIVLVTRPVSDVLDEFESRTRVIGIVAGILTIFVLGFAVMLSGSLHALTVLRNELRGLASVDPLTGAMNRRSFDELAHREFSRAMRNKRPLSALMLDLDFFKKVNDTYGHAAGDTVLKKCFTAWDRELRMEDILGRLGGEEFCVVLPETGMEMAQLVAERLREATARLEFNEIAPDFHITVSIGLAEISQADLGLVTLLDRADKALYKAKASGRNAVATD